jgi:hypothetical protein
VKIQINNNNNNNNNNNKLFNGVLVFHITGFERMCDEPIISYMELE